MRRVLVILLVLLLSTGTALAAADTSKDITLFCMDTVMTLTAYGDHAEEGLKRAEALLLNLDERLSTENAQSEIARLNQTGSAELSDETLAVLQKAVEVSQMTDNTFDFTIYPLMTLWGFMTDSPAVPSPEAVAARLPYVDAGEVRLEGNKVTLGEKQQIDLGGIAKGYASAKVMEVFSDCGITSAVISLGGNCQVLGEKPDGSAWRIGIRDPHPNSGDIAAVVSVKDCAVITSGGYERYFEENGETYIHILDPETGNPVRNSLASVTIISKDGALADALATALFIMGEDKAVEFWREHGAERFEVVLIRDDNSMVVTEGLKDVLKTEAPCTFALREA